jgi:hypothetical protein
MRTRTGPYVISLGWLTGRNLVRIVFGSLKTGIQKQDFLSAFQ